MKCYLCNKKGQIKQQKGRVICNECFCRLIEKRVRKNARLNEIFKKGDKILVVGELNKYFTKSIVKGLPVELFFKAKEDKDFIKKEKINKVLRQETIDDNINLFLENLFLGKRMIKKHNLNLLDVITDKEAELFAKIKGLRFKANKKNKDIQLILDEMEKKDQGAKFRLFKNMGLLNKLI